MKKTLILLAVLALLYLVPSLILQAVYGPSYGFLAGENHWVPDGHGGWRPQGKPVGPPPTVKSVDVPLFWRYLPILLPGILLAVFLLTPLSRRIDSDTPSEAPGRSTETSF
ncbi:MAG: hypothetical protein D6800_05755 [Candidatus Zixiibacteriota bacterium]|nr:MAG: hypothetical protein D6800_05755 [candidate division Zixibacteria bacterium]